MRSLLAQELYIKHHIVINSESLLEEANRIIM